jgi:hypothetical protein
MPDLRTLVLAAIFAGLIGTTTRGDAILRLGVVSSLPDPSASSADFGAANWGSPLAVGASSGPVVSPNGNGFNSATDNTTSPLANSYTVPPTPSPTPAVAPTPAPAAAPATYDAYINLGNGPFPNAGSLTTGTALPWYDSSQMTRLFGGQPTAQQQASFDNTVLQRVQQTFALSGIPVTLTENPTIPAAHTLSVVSNTVNPSMSSAIGMTDIGGNGFHFIDNSAQYAQSVDQLEWIVAHNISHELMLAFGVPENYDQTGKYIDSTVGQMSMFLNPNATFSPGAAQALLSQNFLATSGTTLAGAQLMDPSAVPEPTTWAIWTLGALAGIVARRRSQSRRASA